MLRSEINSENSPTPKKIYKAIRVGQKKESLSSQETETQSLRNSPTLKTQEKAVTCTQPAYPELEFQVYGKRKSEFEVITTLKYFKKSEDCMVEQKVVGLLNPESNETEYFKFFDEEEILESKVDLQLEQFSEDYATTVTQIRGCKEFLEKELIKAILDA